MIRFIIFLFCVTYQVQAFASNCKPVIAVYPAWKHSQEVLTSLPWHGFTHIALFGIYPDKAGNFDSDSINLLTEDVVKLAHMHGKKVILSIGGAGEASKAYRTIAADKQLREKFASNVATYLKKYKLDGIDIDWEYWTFQSELGKGGNDPVESNNLVKLLAAIKATLPKEALLTTDIIAGSWLGEQYLSAIQKHVDFVNLMTFDFTGQWDRSPIDHHSNYKTFKQAVDYAMSKGFSKDKLLVGIPAYGKEFINGKNTQVKDISYSDAVKLAEQRGVKLSRGRIENIYFETQDNVIKKTKYLSKNNFPGIFLYEITSDHASPELSLLQAASEELNPIECY